MAIKKKKKRIGKKVKGHFWVEFGNRNGSGTTRFYNTKDDAIKAMRRSTNVLGTNFEGESIRTK